MVSLEIVESRLNREIGPMLTVRNWELPSFFKVTLDEPSFYKIRFYTPESLKVVINELYISDFEIFKRWLEKESKIFIAENNFTDYIIKGEKVQNYVRNLI